MASTIDKIKNKVEQVTSTGPYSNKNSTTGTTSAGTAGTTTGAVGTGAGSTNAGPHSSNLANKVDPRVDSDLDGSRHAPNNAGRSGLTGSSNTAGPHSTDIGNRIDPRVDSTSTAGVGGTGVGGTGVGHTGGHHSGVGTPGYGTSTRATGTSNYDNSSSTTTGPHSSNILNKADPRVDSDRDGSRNLGAADFGPGAAGNTGTTTTGAGLTGTTGHHGHHHGHHGHHGHHSTGPAPNTAGPHSSDIANKLDPRVDSDLDGSKTVGGNQTYNA